MVKLFHGMFSLLALGLGVSAGAATCDLSYLPLGQATYQVTAGDQKVSFTTTSKVSGNGASGQASVIDAEYRWDCVGKDLHSLIKLGGQTINLNKGTFMPPATAWKVGYSWSNTATAYMDTTPQKTISVTATNRIVAREKLTVPAGTFDAYRVEASGKVGSNISKMTFWYAQGYGMLKQLDQTTGAETVLIKFVK